MDSERLSDLQPPKQSINRGRMAVWLYLSYLVISFAALCVYLSQVQHASAYFIILAWLISVLLLPIPRRLLLNRRKITR
jgi:hypothetical protein